MYNGAIHLRDVFLCGGNERFKCWPIKEGNVFTIKTHNETCIVRKDKYRKKIQEIKHTEK